MPKLKKHHCVYVVELQDVPGGTGRDIYVGMTGVSPEKRFENHKKGYKAASVVKKYGVRLLPELYEHMNPMSWATACEMEVLYARQLKRRGYNVYGGH
jgi:predicted GIY-YIG superfamily endonuclease